MTTDTVTAGAEIPADAPASTPQAEPTVTMAEAERMADEAYLRGRNENIEHRIASELQLSRHPFACEASLSFRPSVWE